MMGECRLSYVILLYVEFVVLDYERISAMCSLTLEGTTSKCSIACCSFFMKRIHPSCTVRTVSLFHIIFSLLDYESEGISLRALPLRIEFTL